MTLLAPSAGDGGRDAMVTAYETLRTHFSTRSTTGGHAGLIVLRRQGVAAWMAHRSALPCPAPPTRRRTLAGFGDEIQLAIVKVLASMALCRQQELPG